MADLESRLDRQSPAYQRNREQMLALLSELAQLEQRAVERSAQAAPAFRKRGKLLPRERLAALLDAGRPFLELMKLAGYCGIENPDPATSVPGAAIIAGVGEVCGVRCMIVVNDSGISAGAMQAMTAQKVMRCQEIALANRLPFIQLVESAGGNLKKYRAERFVHGGGMFYNLAKLSAAGIPVISLVHGSSTAGGAYLRVEGGGIQLHAPGKVELKAGVHSWVGPESSQPNLAFSEAVVEGLWRTVSWDDLGMMVGVNIILLVAILLATWYGSKWLGFNRPDRITIMFCGSKKSLASGAPMASAIFAGANVGSIVLPLMLFHQIQLMACAVIARKLADHKGHEERVAAAAE